MKPIILQRFILLILTSLNLVSANSQEISTVGEIYDYEIGDIFHNEGKYFDDYSKSINEITDKYYSIGLDTVFYSIYYQRATQYMGDTSWNYSTGTFSFYYTHLDSLINYGEITNVFSDPNYYNGRKVNVYSPCDCEVKYFVEGCGLAWDYFFDQSVMQTIIDKSLVYYKKGTEEWGNPLTLYTGLSPIKDQVNISVYPNPTINSITIVADNIARLTEANIYTLNGKVVKSCILNIKGTTEIDLTTLDKGIYILELINSTNIIRKKIIKK